MHKLVAFERLFVKQIFWHFVPSIDVLLHVSSYVCRCRKQLLALERASATCVLVVHRIEHIHVRVCAEARIGHLRQALNDASKELYIRHFISAPRRDDL